MMKTVRKVLAVTLAALLLLQPGMASFAETLPLPAAAEEAQAAPEAEAVPEGAASEEGLLPEAEAVSGKAAAPEEEAGTTGEETVLKEMPETEEASVLKTESRVANTPVILVQPADQTVAAGETAVFSVRAEGEELSYQWQYQFKDETVWKLSKLESGKSADLSVPAKAAWDGMKFRCVVTNAYGNSVKTEEAAMLLKVPEVTLVITEQPVDQTVKAGETAVFSVKAEGEGLSYQWQYQMKNETVWKLSKLDSGKSAELSVPAKASWEGMKFRCVVTDASGASLITDTAALLLQVPETVLEITEQPVDQTVKAGETAVFSVKAEGEGLSYQWQYQMKNETVWKLSKLESGKSADLSVPAKASWEGMKFRCVVTDASGASLITNTAALLLQVPETAPEITEQPQDQTVKAGETAVFSVKATGKDLKYQWEYQVKGQTAWKSSTQKTGKSETLTFKMVSSWDGMKFRCVVTDSSGASVTSEEAVLTLRSALKITAQPADQAVKAGETAVFSVKAEGEGLSYQWQYQVKNETTWKTSKLETGKSADLRVPAESASDGMKFRCVITDVTGTSLITDSAVFTLLTSLVITQQPQDQTVGNGETAVFSVKAAGEGLRYQWQYQLKGQSTWKMSTQESGKSDTLTFTMVSSWDGMKFRCVITDSSKATVTSEEAVLTLRTALKISKQPADQAAKAGKTAVFSVTAAGTGLQYQWQSSKDGKTWTDMKGSTETSCSVSITSALNGYSYRCVVTDAFKQKVTSSAAKLTVKAALQISTQPKDQSVKYGTSISFSVKATGDSVKYQWQYQLRNETVWKQSTETTGKSATLKTTVGISGWNQMKFRCIVTDSDGDSVTSDTAVLTVTNAFEILKQPEDQSAAVGETVTFTVEAEGAVKYQWFSSRNGKSWSKIKDATKNYYSVKVSTSNNGWQYHCWVINSSNKYLETSAAKLTIKSSEEQKISITKQPESQKAASGTTVTFSVTATGTGLSYQWQSSKDGITWNAVSGATKASCSVKVSTSNDGTLYRCVITDSAKNTVTSSVAVLTLKKTLKITKQPVSQTAKAGEQVPFSITAEGDGLTYEWMYSIDKGKTWKSFGKSENSEIQMFATTSTYPYQVRCVVTDEYDASVTSSTVTLTIKN